mmetsp:Transcript_3819/g.12333  ORF Transcript_3819/g.12333 Transcript_3819/m.12333 type:complete len:249 (+) Transcript_3819:1293-2039(+)
MPHLPGSSSSSDTCSTAPPSSWSTWPSTSERVYRRTPSSSSRRSGTVGSSSVAPSSVPSCRAPSEICASSGGCVSSSFACAPSRLIKTRCFFRARSSASVSRSSSCASSRARFAVSRRVVASPRRRFSSSRPAWSCAISFRSRSASAFSSAGSVYAIRTEPARLPSALVKSSEYSPLRPLDSCSIESFSLPRLTFSVLLGGGRQRTAVVDSVSAGGVSVTVTSNVSSMTLPCASTQGGGRRPRHNLIQ